jgi:hypothetical protein
MIRELAGTIRMVLGYSLEFLPPTYASAEN